MPHLNGFDASVVSENNEALYHATTIDEAERTLTCWIPAQVGKAFSVNWRCKWNTMSTRGDIYIDGAHSGFHRLRAEDGAGMDNEYCPTVSVSSRNLNTKKAKSPFQFDAHAFSLEGTPENSAPIENDHTGLGEIRLVISRSLLDLAENPSIEELKNVSDKAMDFIQHVATFVFKYRSPEYLEKHNFKNRPTIILKLDGSILDVIDNISHAQGISSSANTVVVHQEAFEDICDEIRAAEEYLNELCAKRNVLEGALVSVKRLRRPELVKTAEQKARKSLKTHLRGIKRGWKMKPKKKIAENGDLKLECVDESSQTQMQILA